MDRDEQTSLLSIEGIVEKIIYQNEENGYTVCELTAPSDESFVLVGSMPYLCGRVNFGAWKLDGASLLWQAV